MTIAAGRAENPPDRNCDLSRAAKLIERFATHRAMILRFVLDLAAPFTNNTAEPALGRSSYSRRPPRPGARLLHSLAAFATVRSYLDTAAKHGVDGPHSAQAVVHHRPVDATSAPKLNTYVRTPWLQRPAALVAVLAARDHGGIEAGRLTAD